MPPIRGDRAKEVTGDRVAGHRLPVAAKDRTAIGPWPVDPGDLLLAGSRPALLFLGHVSLEGMDCLQEAESRRFDTCRGPRDASTTESDRRELLGVP